MGFLENNWRNSPLFLRNRNICNMQIMPEIITLGFIYALPVYRYLMRAEGPKHIPVF